MQRDVDQAAAAASPPNPALHGAALNDLQASCRESRARITSLQAEIR